MAKNILFLLVDQWPATCFGHRGTNIKTPTIDKLAQEGTLFTNAFTSCPLCSPARGALFTSKWHTQSGMVDNLGVGYSQQKPLDMSEKTWLDAAVNKGYHVGYYGKWHLGPDGPIHRGVQRHPETIEDFQKPYVPGVSDYNYRRCQKGYIIEGEETLKSGVAPFYGNIDGTIDESNPFMVAEQAKKFLEEYAEEAMEAPFLLTVSINDPHFPHYLPEAYVESVDDFEVDLPINIENDFNDKPWFHNKSWWPSMDTSNLTKEDWREVIKYAYMHRMLVDEALGQVIETLDQLALTEDTTIIFTSDHGDMCGAHSRFDKGPYYYDEVWRIPLIIKEPKSLPKKQEAFVSILDVGRTVFDMVDESLDVAYEGLNITPLIGSTEAPKSWPKEVYGMYDTYNGMSFKIRAIRNQRFKYIYNPQSVDELYDMEKDPGEMTNLNRWPRMWKEKEALRFKLFQWMNRIEDPLLDSAATLPDAGTILPLGKPGP